MHFEAEVDGFTLPIVVGLVCITISFLVTTILLLMYIFQGINFYGSLKRGLKNKLWLISLLNISLSVITIGLRWFALYWTVIRSKSHNNSSNYSSLLHQIDHITLISLVIITVSPQKPRDMKYISIVLQWFMRSKNAIYELMMRCFVLSR